MDTPIYFDNKPYLVAIKIDNIGLNHLLAAKMKAPQAAGSQAKLQGFFGQGHLRAHLLGPA